MTTKTVLAVDLGAESGRVMAVHLQDGRLSLEELHRFPNGTIELQGTIYWDILALWKDIKTGIEIGKAHSPISIGVDTWGVDFGLLDRDGHLIGNPVNYRDARTNGMQTKVFETVSREQVFEQTGIQFMPINTLYQMMSLVASSSPQLEIAETFLTIPDLINYWLTGRKVCEFSNTTTTQMFNPNTGTWAYEMLDALDFKTDIFPEIVMPGTRLGEYDGIPVIAVACHDTGSAVAGVPASSEKYAYISSGTWSLVGLEVDKPIINGDALSANVTNEGGVFGSYRFLKNVMGLWIVQQCRSTWAAAGDELDYEALTEIASAVSDPVGIFPVNDPRLLAPGDHPAIIRSLCAEHQQPIPSTKGEVIRAVLESLAVKYSDVLKNLLNLSNKQADVIHIVGGGTQNHLLNQLTANATGKPVITGPVEATVLGNGLMQLITAGEIADLAAGRAMIAKSFEVEQYNPQP
ncbi:MAG: rhamnulokinase family protein [Chloroflexota bacterium]